MIAYHCEIKKESPGLVLTGQPGDILGQQQAHGATGLAASSPLFGSHGLIKLPVMVLTVTLSGRSTL